MIPKNAIKRKRNRDRIRKSSGIKNKTRKEYEKAVKNEDWETAHTILADIVMNHQIDNV